MRHSLAAETESRKVSAWRNISIDLQVGEIIQQTENCHKTIDTRLLRSNRLFRCAPI